ncbi:RDD family protein [[Mycobacterium] kokjensenii]|uniref:RDD family protein n=1 Tax=[Mycobacterium] kokjensenii TaxID=3064287 RepID=A0ABM9L632_9MYCO|nr:RDD family protein [Mycolicibacter sp. MU0083]CAJ1493034.1 RDD family protein [Mycolicibacter sp. MU0083]
MTDSAVQQPGGEPVPWRTRAQAFAIDIVPGAIVMVSMGLVAMGLPLGSAWWWVTTIVAAVAFLATEVNRMLLPAITGFSLGRAFTGIEVVRSSPGKPVGAVRLMLREAAHLLDTVPLLLGWLWPLRDKRRRTFADRLTGTEVRAAGDRRPPADIAVKTAGVFVAAAVLAVLAASSGYFLVYQREHATQVARTQIARQGPKIVADMLSYDPQTLDDDFARARSLATERYREQLVPEQEKIRGTTPVPNLYRVTDAAVLDAAPHRATMLLFLQGQRGTVGKGRLITATVRVTFVEADRTWRVDDLTVGSNPNAGEGEK